MAVPQRYHRIISADSHVTEPHDTWWNAIGHKYGDRTPRIVDEWEGKKERFFYTGYKGAPVTQLGLREPTLATASAVVEAREMGFRASGYDPDVRVRFQEEAGIEAEVMNSSSMLSILRNPDTEIVLACAQVFNDWEAEFCSYNPKRLIGVSVIPMDDVDWAIKELERTLQKGLTPMINCRAPEGCPPYRRSVYDRFWAATEEAGVPVLLHLLTGQVLDPLLYAAVQTPEEAEENPGQWMALFNEIQTVLANDFIFGGILDRFPKLKVVLSEFEMSWLPGFIAHLDQLEGEFGPLMHIPKMKMRASDYMRTRVYHGFIDDTFAALCIPVVGVDQVLWGSDFPHGRSMGLDAQSTIHKLIETLPREDQEKIVGGNAAKVFNVVG